LLNLHSLVADDIGGGGRISLLSPSHTRSRRVPFTQHPNTPEVGGLLCQQFYLPALNPVRVEEHKIKRIEYHEGV